MNLQKANKYLDNHLFNDKWVELDDDKKESALQTAKNILLANFNFRKGVEETDTYLHAVCEQAIHLLNMDKERIQLKQEGVSYYAIDGFTFQMDTSIISPIAKSLLKKITKLRVGYAK
jgi:hypothetical protein